MPSGGRREGAGRRSGFTTKTITRNRQRAMELMRRLYLCATGELEMSPSQLTATLGFLRKVVPDLKAIEHSGEIAHRHVTELSDEELLAIAAERGARIVEEEERPTVN